MASCRCCAVLLLAALIAVLLGVWTVTRTTTLDRGHDGAPGDDFDEPLETFEASLKGSEEIERNRIQVASTDSRSEERHAGATDGGNEDERHAGATDSGNDELSLDGEPDRVSNTQENANELSLGAGENDELPLRVGHGGPIISMGPTPRAEKHQKDAPTKVPRPTVPPELLAYDEGRVVDEDLFEAYQEARYADLRAYLKVIKHKLKAKNLKVSFYPNRAELEPVKKAFATMGAKIQQLGKGGKAAEKSGSDLVVVYSYVANKYKSRLDVGKHALALEQPFLRPQRFLPKVQGDVKNDVHRSYTWDGNNYRGMHPQPSATLPAHKRWARKFSKDLRIKRRPGIENATRAVILGQLETDSTQVPIRRRFGSSNAFYQWAADEVKRLAPHLQVLFKAHPQEMKRTKKYFVPTGAVDASKKDLKQALSDAAVAIVANSNAGLVAMGAGVPVLALDPGFMGWRCSLHDPEDLRRLPDLATTIDQSKCMHEVALGQWAYDEVKNMLSVYLNPDNYWYNKTLMPRISGRAAPAEAA